jgi:CRISPR-associated endonuclease/helicase Cas3
MIYYAHTATKRDGSPDPDESKWQLLRDHLRNVAELAAKFAAPFGASNEARVAGLLHDLGKYAGRFQARLRDPRIHGINHWAAGAAYAANHAQPLIAFPIDGHHTGLPAKFGNEGLQQTLLKFADPIERERLTACSEDLTALIQRYVADGLPPPPTPASSRRTPFASALRARFLLSSLTDADFLDTESHFSPANGSLRHSCLLHESRAFDLVMSDLAGKASASSLGRLRRDLLDACLERAELPPGLFTLTAPTGSGKTLASLAFALRHIVRHNRNLTLDDPRRLRRIIVVIHYTSIIEQTARIFRELFTAAFGDDYVLEHHANIAPSTEPGAPGHDAEDARIRRARLAAENWSSPLVVTTNVRFFESLFANKPAACRRLHAISRSVVLFDEVQTLPPTLAPSLLSATRLLVGDYGCTTVFMTATQPAFATVPLAKGLDAWAPTEINPRPEAFAEALRRTEIVLETSTQPLTWPEVASRLSAHDQSLCVVNTTAHARELFQQLPAGCRFHLSSRLCPAHRSTVLAEVRRRLHPDNPQRCHLVSTQLIEAGVDIDFPAVYRAFGPLDSILQTAGRCNREGRMIQPGRVTVFHPADAARPPGLYSLATDKTEEFLTRHAGAALDQPATYARYFEEFYRLAGPDAAERDAVLKLSENFDFPAAAEKCRYIDSSTRAVVVEWGEGADLIQKLQRERHLTADECRHVQRFSVNLYPHEFAKAQTCGAVVQPAPDFDLWVWKGHYDPELGAVSATANDCII